MPPGPVVPSLVTYWNASCGMSMAGLVETAHASTTTEFISRTIAGS